MTSDIGLLHRARRAHRHLGPITETLEADGLIVRTYRCGHRVSEEAAKRGRNNRSRGGRAELAIARRFGGEKVGPLGLPEDIRGKQWATQVKVSRRSAPPAWLREFAKMDAGTGGRMPRLILRFTRSGGLAKDRTQDFVVIRGEDWLDWYGRDE